MKENVIVVEVVVEGSEILIFFAACLDGNGLN